jgi:hypothetical protein
MSTIRQITYALVSKFYTTTSMDVNKCRIVF